MTSDPDDATLGDRTISLRRLAAAAPVVRVGHFIAYADGERLRRVEIGAPGVSVGRQPPCDIVIAAPDISRRHCRIDLDGDWAVASDLGSTNGTFLGGTRIEQPTRLRNGSRLTLGSVEIRYERRDTREVAEEAELTAELRQAADYVRAILPAPIAAGPVQADWWFVPSSRLGGDAFGYQFLDAATFTGFVLDISGHGIGSAMHAVTVANALRRRALPGVDFRDPAQVAAGLNAMFPMEDYNELMLTLWYFAYDLPSRLLRYCSAGHHPSFLLAPGAPEPVPLWARSPAIGMLPGGRWTTGSTEAPPGSRVYLFSDGAFEIVPARGTPWTIANLGRLMTQPEHPGRSEAQFLYEAVRAAAPPGPLADDFAMLVLRFP